MTPDREGKLTPLDGGPVAHSRVERERDADQVARAALTGPEGPMHHAGSTSNAHGLSAATAAEMEQRFGRDFSRVRIRTDAEAARLAGALGARAFTLGESVVFAQGEFAPATTQGRLLLAHELAHVTQQRATGRAELALQPASGRPALDQVVEIQQALDNAGSGTARRPVVRRALGLADDLALALAAATGPNPPAGSTTADDAREGLIRLGRSLAANGEAAAAIQVARKSRDAAVKNAILTTLRGSGRGVAGQQRSLTAVAPLAGERIAPARPSEKSTDWLERTTRGAGRTFKKLEQEGLEGLAGSQGRYEAPEGKSHTAGLEMSQEVLEQYFLHVERDVIPDPLGKLGRYQIDPNTNQIEADCDVYATYGARLLREQGWETAGYLAIVPEEKKADNPDENRDAHAVALARKPNPAGGWAYLGISNAVIRDLSIWSSDENARVMLLRLALEIYRPRLKRFKAYYLPAGKGGALDLRLLDPAANGLTPLPLGGTP